MKITKSRLRELRIIGQGMLVQGKYAIMVNVGLPEQKKVGERTIDHYQRLKGLITSASTQKEADTRVMDYIKKHKLSDDQIKQRLITK
jgi:hypothetical protein